MQDFPQAAAREEQQPDRRRREGTDLMPIAERFAVAGALRDSLGTAVDGATGLQSVVPLVCRPFAR
jgi:hypothetical protein